MELCVFSPRSEQSMELCVHLPPGVNKAWSFVSISPRSEQSTRLIPFYDTALYTWRVRLTWCFFHNPHAVFDLPCLFVFTQFTHHTTYIILFAAQSTHGIRFTPLSLFFLLFFLFFFFSFLFSFFYSFFSRVYDLTRFCLFVLFCFVSFCFLSSQSTHVYTCFLLGLFLYHSLHSIYLIYSWIRSTSVHCIIYTSGLELTPH